MPDKPGEKKPPHSQTRPVVLLSSIIVRIYQRTAERSLAAEDGDAFCAGKRFNHDTRANLKTDIRTEAEHAASPNFVSSCYFK